MHGKAFMILLAAIMNFSVSMGSDAGEVQVQTGRINIEHRRHGNTNIDTETIKLSVPNHRSRFRNYFPDNSSQPSTLNGCRNGRMVHQSSQQINDSNRTSSRSSISHHQCY
ncbi:hypothetical protein [Crocosphaera sp.]|uniref:hypothetical protein n=1 Tax=Crocosphaera sp. TaxID=2729996 RepID=UPI003F1EE722|nr:hypothetical protein [Crocosphaera sp.]